MKLLYLKLVQATEVLADCMSWTAGRSRNRDLRGDGDGDGVVELRTTNNRECKWSGKCEIG